MATQLRDLLTLGGTHHISNINSKGAKPLVNGAILGGSDLDNGSLVELDGFDTEGNRKCKPWEGTATKYFVQTSEQDQMLTEYGENQITMFYNKVGEIIRIYKVYSGLRTEISNYTVKASTSMTYGSKVFYNVDTNAYIVNGDASGSVIEIGEVVGMDTDFGANAGKETIRVEWL